MASVCPKCGSRSPANTCPKCGTALAPTPPAADDPAVTPPAISSAVKAFAWIAGGFLLLLILLAQLDKAPATTRHLTRAEFGDRWPLTVDEGDVSWEGGAVLFTANGKTYAVNGTALGSGKWPRIDEIWAADPKMPPQFHLRKSIGPIIEAGLALAPKEQQ